MSKEKQAPQKAVDYAKDTFFKKDPTLAAMLYTSDGNWFFPSSANVAKVHANDHCNGDLFVIQRPADMPMAKSSFAVNAKETIKLIKAAESIDELELILEDGESRQTVLTAFDNKKAELSTTVEASKGTAQTEPGSGPADPEKDPLEPQVLIDLIGAVTTEELLDALEAEHNLSKHENADVVAAYEAKEDEFLSS